MKSDSNVPLPSRSPSCEIIEFEDVNARVKPARERIAADMTMAIKFSPRAFLIASFLGSCFLHPKYLSVIKIA